MMKRLGTAIIGGPIVIAILVLGNPILIDVLLALIAIRSINEYNNCAKKTTNTISWLSYIPAVLVAFIHIISVEIWYKILPIAIPVFLLLQFIQVVVTDGKTSYKDIVYTTTGTLYIVSLLAFLSLLYGAENGKILVWFIMFAAWGSDIFAYLTGKYLGKHKFSKISPNKTIEGCIGGLVGAIVLCLIYAVIMNNAFQLNLVYWQIVIIAIVLGAIGQIGDFAASSIKRHFEVKDFSDIFPGHGGMIDRIDSIIFIAPFAYYIFVILLG